MSASVFDAANAIDALIGAAQSGSPPSGAFDASLGDLQALGDEIERRAVGNAGAAAVAGRVVVALADRAGGAKARARTRRALAQALAYAGDLHAALDTARDAATIAREGGEPVEAARAQIAALHPLAALGRFAEAIETGASAHDALLAAGEPELAARADLNLGAVCAMRDDPAAALAYFDRALPVLQGNPVVLAQLETNRGNALTALDDYRGAGEAFARAADAFQHSGHPLAAAIAEGNRAFLAGRQGALQRALAHFEQARRLLDEVAAPSHRARVLAEQADLLVMLGLPHDALRLLDEIDGDLRAGGAPLEIARARTTRGRAAIAAGRYDEAEAALREAAASFADFAQPVDHAQVGILRARLALERGEIATARALAAVARAAVAARPAGRALAALTVARIELAAGDLAAAARAAGAARADAEQLGIAPLLADALMLEGRIRRRQGLPALDAFAAAVAETERVRGTLQAERLRSTFQGDRLAPYTELARAAIETENVAVAFQAIELAKSRGLLDRLGAADDGNPDRRDDPLARELADRRAELNWAYSQLGGDGRQTTRQRLRELETEVHRLELRIAALRPGDLAAARPVELATAMAALAPNEAAIVYFALDDEIVALSLAGGACRAHRGFAVLPDIEHAARRLRLQIARAQARSGALPARLVEDANRELGVLWDQLLAPVIDAVAGADRVIVVPHGLLHALPFAAFTDGARALIDRFELVTVPSLSLWTHLRDRDAGDTGDRAAVIGVADELAATIPEEVADVARALPGSKVLLGEDATVAGVTGLIAGADPIHVACHGRFDRAHPRASGLKLADRWLTLGEIGTLELNGAHVTLSACDTGRAAVHAGDDLIGLTRAFYAAGARSLIYTLWPVHDERTAAVMTALYREVGASGSFSCSLRSAQLALRAQHPHPAYWAPFCFGGA